MSAEEMKIEINKVLDHLPAKALEDLLSFLKNFERSEKSFFNEKNFKKILDEDKALLKKLAQ